MMIGLFQRLELFNILTEVMVIEFGSDTVKDLVINTLGLSQSLSKLPQSVDFYWVVHKTLDSSDDHCISY